MLLTIQKNLFDAYIAPHFDGRDSAHLRRTCKLLKNWVETNPTLKKRLDHHWINLDNVSDLEPWLGDWIVQGISRELPIFIGEGLQFGPDYYISNFYEKSQMIPVKKLQGFKWRFFTYPQLEGIGRWKIGPFSFHRGAAIQVFDKNYIVYCLASGKHTYIGCTNDIQKRLRQHNGERAGGARYTRAYRPWSLSFTIRGFANKKEAFQFEWCMKHKRAKGGPMKTFEKLVKLERWNKLSIH